MSLEDINNKLSEAENKRNARAISPKTISHNANVEKAKAQFKEHQTDRDEALEKQINSKLSNAEAKRDGMMNSWVQRLSGRAGNKQRRAAKVKDDEKWQAKELEVQLDIKGLTAELRREEIKMKT